MTHASLAGILSSSCSANEEQQRTTALHMTLICSAKFWRNLENTHCWLVHLKSSHTRTYTHTTVSASGWRLRRRARDKLILQPSPHQPACLAMRQQAPRLLLLQLDDSYHRTHKHPDTHTRSQQLADCEVYVPNSRSLSLSLLLSWNPHCLVLPVPLPFDPHFLSISGSATRILLLD